MKKIELIYDSSCPNIERSRERIREVLSELNMPHEWDEWDRANPKAPDYVSRYGSPTILVNGRDVANITDGTAGDSCRLYRNEKGGVEGVPSIQNIKQAMMQKNTAPANRGWLASLTVIPAVAVSSLPFLSCPLCWPLYTSVLGATGLSFFNYTPYLFPVTLVLLLVALASIWYQAKKSGLGYKPLWLGIGSATAILMGKFFILYLWILVPGVLGIIAASLWNFVRISKSRKKCCCAKQRDV